MFSSSISFAQNLFPPTGNSYIGSGSSNGAQLQLYSTNSYSVSVPGYYDIYGGYTAGYTVDYGPTSRLSLTNSFCGLSGTDGGLIRMSKNDLTIENLEKKMIQIKSNNAFFNLDGATNRIWAGMAPIPDPEFSYLNVRTNDNGIYVRSTEAGKYGISFQMAQNDDLAIRVVNPTSGAGDYSFAVQSNGHVYGRKFTTTLNNIPDYVFRPDYKLMPLQDLRSYIQENEHLPNIPSAKEYEETGVDLGELNRLLLEKVEELTLYVLELEERMNAVEKN